jgi:hypothetical protein
MTVYPTPEILCMSDVVETVTWGTGWRRLLRQFATSRKIPASIPDGIIDLNLPAAL